MNTLAIRPKHPVPQIQRNLPTQTRPETTSLRYQASIVPPGIAIMYKSGPSDTETPQKMAAPVKVGTKGTVGSLIMQEIEYFRRVELSCRGSSQKPRTHVADMASCSNPAKPTSGSLLTHKKKRRGSSNRLVPSICSMVEVSDNKRPVGTSSFNYRNLKLDMDLQA